MVKQVMSDIHPPDLLETARGASSYAAWVSRFTLDTQKMHDFGRWATRAAREMESLVPEGVAHVGLFTVLEEDVYEVWDVWSFATEPALEAWNLFVQRPGRFRDLMDESLTFADLDRPINRRILREVSQRPLLGVTKFGVNI
jgi:hypothetical protein